MYDFSHLGSRRKVLATAVIALEMPNGDRLPLTCKPANEDNKPFYNELLKRERRWVRRGMKMSAKVTDDRRRDDAELYAKHCIVSWPEGAVSDAEGNDVPFSKESCQALLDYVRRENRQGFDDFRNDIADTSTFEGDEDESTGEGVEAQAGN